MNVQRNYFLVAPRVIALILWVLVMPLVLFMSNAIKHSGRTNLPRHFHRGVCWILGIRVSYSGELYQQSPALYLSNHISYLDAFALGKIKAYYISKTEVASWPIIGTYIRLQNTLFFERKAGRAKEQVGIMHAHLLGGKSLILFPEGTSTNGTYVEPFKSSLIASAELPIVNGCSPPKVAIQPVTIAYTHHAGNKMDQTVRDYYAWYATMPFGSHAAALLALKKVDVKVHFHPVCYLDQFETRKVCAEHCHSVVFAKLLEFIV